MTTFEEYLSEAKPKNYAEYAEGEVAKLPLRKWSFLIRLETDWRGDWNRKWLIYRYSKGVRAELTFSRRASNTEIVFALFIKVRGEDSAFCHFHASNYEEFKKELNISIDKNSKVSNDPSDHHFFNMPTKAQYEDLFNKDELEMKPETFYDQSFIKVGKQPDEF